MYNKLASIILNSGKNPNYAGEVFVAQPDSAKEKLAGKIFVLAEIEGRKNDSQKIINFLVNFFEYNYYGDEKIALRDKIEGLNIENIFEGVLAKVNRGLADFIQEEKLRIEADKTNLTIGVVYENKLYFSNFGKNKAFLVFRRKGNYEIINIETVASDGENINLMGEDGHFGKIFSAVINGEIPQYSYFLFMNEALPEYLSNSELVNIITKLPPMVAAEQIKNSLQKINSFAPFLGIVIKSTVGLNISEESLENEIMTRVAGDKMPNRGSAKNAHSSISHLNYTEQKTERMLAPAGIISPRKLIKAASSLLSGLGASEKRKPNKVVKLYEEENKEPEPIKEDRKPNKDLARRDSFLIKDKIVFKRKTSNILPNLLKSLGFIALIFHPSFWVGVYRGLVSWVKNLNKKNRILVAALLACVVILAVSVNVGIAGRKTRIARENFDKVIADVNGKQDQVESYLLYDNRIGALAVLNEANNLLQSNAAISEEQLSQKESLLAELKTQKDKIQKITEVNKFDSVMAIETSSAQSDSLLFMKDKLYVADNISKTVNVYGLKDSSVSKLNFESSLNISSSATDGESAYYLAGNKVVKINGETVSVSDIGPEKLSSDNLIQIYNGSFYLLSQQDNQIYKYKKSNNNLNGRSAWLKDSANLSDAKDLEIDGSLWVTKTTGDLLRFFKNKKADFQVASIDPVFRADRIIVKEKMIYALDINNNRLILLNKDGSLNKQYRITKEGLRDFVVDEAAKTVYILANGGVYRFSF